MTIEHPDAFHGLTVLTLPVPGEDPVPGGLPAADSVAWRLECGWKELTFPELWQHFLGSVDPTRVRALMIGPWWQEDYTPFAPVVERIVADAHRFPALRALFLADVVGEECEVSWLEMCDITPLIDAFPLLEELTVRGCGDSGSEEEKLRLRPVRHGSLKSLRFESGGLPGHVVRAVGASELPALERLELWLGVDWYGGDTTVDDMRPVLSGAAFPGCATWACRTAISRTRSRRLSPPPRSSPSWSRSRSRWAPSVTKGRRPSSTVSRSPI